MGGSAFVIQIPIIPPSFEGVAGGRAVTSSSGTSQPVRQGQWPGMTASKPYERWLYFFLLLRKEKPTKNSILYNVHFSPFELEIQQSKVEIKIQHHSLEPESSF